MMTKLKVTVLTLVMAFGLAAPLCIASPALAADPCAGKTGPAKTNCEKLHEGTEKAQTTDQSIPEVIKNVVSVMMFITGTLSVVMIIYGGIRYTTSAGDSSKITSAKHTITYAVVGLVVSVLAYAIVSFVTANIT
ncbi:MAG: pilin [Candidatus Nomurabacteria bacterium]|jgi:hypothetical protein|nr:pilin [Candidatus Nomurabacteria bacterium]